MADRLIIVTTAKVILSNNMNKGQNLLNIKDIISKVIIANQGIDIGDINAVVEV